MRCPRRIAGLLAVALSVSVGLPWAGPGVGRIWPTATTDRASHYRQFEGVEELAAWLSARNADGPVLSAHRGGPVPGYPENALATFDRSLHTAPCLLECDVRATADGVLVLLHDSQLDRTTDGEGSLADATLGDLRTLRLVDGDGRETAHRIPTLAEALAWAEGRGVLTLDVKRGVTPKAVVDAIRASGAENRVAVIVYDVETFRRYRRAAPDLVYSVSARDADTLAGYRAAGLRLDRALVFVGVGRFDRGYVRDLRRLGVRSILGTFGDLDRSGAAPGSTTFVDLLADGVGMLATDALDAAAPAVRSVAETGAGSSGR